MVCDKEVARKESSTEIWPAFPFGRLFAGKPTGVEAARGSVLHQPATASVIIGPVHPRTMNEMFMHPSGQRAPDRGRHCLIRSQLRLFVGRIQPQVRPRHGRLRPRRPSQSHRLPPEPRLGGTFATPLPIAESTRAKAVKTKAGRTFVRVRDGMHVGQVC